MASSQRLLSLDILRGITVAGMILVNNGWGESFEMLQHSKWNGMTPCDLVFPFFLFMVGFLMLGRHYGAASCVQFWQNAFCRCCFARKHESSSSTYSSRSRSTTQLRPIFSSATCSSWSKQGYTTSGTYKSSWAYTWCSPCSHGTRESQLESHSVPDRNPILMRVHCPYGQFNRAPRGLPAVLSKTRNGLQRGSVRDLPARWLGSEVRNIAASITLRYLRSCC